MTRETFEEILGTSKEIPKFQRRGAIITLGMFAQPKPEVVADHVETLLKIGLGSLGRVRLPLFLESVKRSLLIVSASGCVQADLVLAKYTCIALGRVAGSVKKVKGSLKDVSVRLPMESPVFSRLAGAIQAPSKSKEW